MKTKTISKVSQKPSGPNTASQMTSGRDTASRSPSPVMKPKEVNKNSQSKSRKAGLVYNVIKMRQKLKKGNYAKNIKIGAAVYLTGVIEYLTAEILELAGDVARQNKRKRIIPRHIMVAIKGDTELDELFKNVDMPAAGVLPHIHPVLLPKRTTRRQSTREGSSDADASQSH